MEVLVASPPQAPRTAAQVKAPKRISVLMESSGWDGDRQPVSSGRGEDGGPGAGVKRKREPGARAGPPHRFGGASAELDTPPEMMKASMSVASAASGRTWSAGTSATRPAKLYDQGM